MRWIGNDLIVEVLYSRAGVATQIFVKAGETCLLFDLGDGTVRDLLENGISPKKIKGAFITHGHADHMAGLYGLLGYLRGVEHTEVFTIWYPRGCCEVEEVISAFTRCYGSSMPYRIIAHPLSDKEVVKLGEIEIQARKVEHWHSIRGKPISPAPALGYRLTFKGQAVALTGDTALCPALKELISGADLALIEATLDDAAASQKEKAYLHLSRSEAKALGRLARVVWLIHTSEGC